jgi:hypothetical protein
MYLSDWGWYWTGDGPLSAQRRYREADSLLISGYALLREGMGDEHRRTALARRRLAVHYEAWGKPALAARDREPLTLRRSPGPSGDSRAAGTAAGLAHWTVLPLESR